MDPRKTDLFINFMTYLKAEIKSLCLNVNLSRIAQKQHPELKNTFY